MTEKELRTWLRRGSLPDSWFVSAGEGQIDPAPLSLDAIYERYSGDASVRGSVLILHESQQHRKEPAWVELDLRSFEDAQLYTPLPSADKSGQRAERSSGAGKNRPQGVRSRRSARRKRGLVIQMLVLVALVVIGGGIWYVATRETPEPMTFAASETEAHNQIISQLQRNMQRNNTATGSDQGEPIRTVISATQRMLMVKNSNLEAWPSFKLKIITPDKQVFHCTFDQEIPAYSTLSISMRKILTDGGKSLVREDLTADTVIQLEIPGYQTWSSKL